MVQWAKLTIASLGLVGTGLGSVIWFGSLRWHRTTSQYVKKIIRAVPQQETSRVTFENFQQLPAPVAKYFRSALKEGQPLVRSAQIVQVGEFRAREADDRWSPFEAKQYFSSQPPGFVWDASIRTAPLMKVRVRDAYVAEQGSMQAKILSLVSVVDEYRKAELNTGALQRYLAEAVWFPTALLPSQRITWSPIAHNKALATLTDAGTTVSLEFHFNAVGEITGVSTSGRYRAVDGKFELTPWVGHFRHYEERGGMRIPVEGEVQWQLPTGAFPYWRGRLVTVEYDFAW
jgi:hypothetical protein